MESLVKSNLLKNKYYNKKVFVTGHTGFKGSWLALWLNHLGAVVKGYSKSIPTSPSHYHLLNLDIEDEIGDVRDKHQLKKSINDFNPDIVFHLAAQPLVRDSYKDPIETYETNVQGTLNLYEACRTASNLKAIVSITTDKVYANKEKNEGYIESDDLGGYDPYSSSKACVELMTNSYRNSFWNVKEYNKSHQVLLSTVRAGNVIGGGDWAKDRLIPDLIRSTIANNPAKIRNPFAIRPWQHVLEPLHGYLILGSSLLDKNVGHASAWNFGPSKKAHINVRNICEIFDRNWNDFKYEEEPNVSHMKETNVLQLISKKSNEKLSWSPIWDDCCIEKTIEWYKAFYQHNEVKSLNQLETYLADLKKCSIED